MTLGANGLRLTIDPAWPWSIPTFGFGMLIACAAALAVLTIWTYRDVRGATRGRVTWLLALRLAALAVAFIVVLRPSVATQDDQKTPSTLLIAADDSESMTIHDQFDNQSRWEYLCRVLRESEPYLQKLRDDQSVSVGVFRFAGDIGDFDPKKKADGKQTDFGRMLQSLADRYAGERSLRGLLVLSDGADNGARFSPLQVAARWRAMPCPIHTFSLGQPTTASQQRDVAITSLTPEPSPVPVKGRLTVRAQVDAAGFENAPVRVRLLFDDKEVQAKDEKLPLSTGNEIRLQCDAPATPGEIKVTLKIDPLPGELTTSNNEMSTFLSVTKEGVSVLYIEGKLRAWEPKFIRYALSQDPRIRLDEAVRLSDSPPADKEADLLQLDKQHYDVIILGDITARRLSAGNPDILAKINKLVSEKGTGLMMIGGYENFANGDFERTDIAKLLPVQLDVRGQVRDKVQMVPTVDGLRHFVLRLAEKESDNAAVWAKLPKLDGMCQLGTPKPGAIVLARTPGGQPILVGLPAYGNGRTMAFAGDTTWQWRKSLEGIEQHARFWKQLVLWLAKQEDAEGSVWVKPDARRVSAGGKLGFSMGIRGKGGVEIKDAKFEAIVRGPGNVESTVPTLREVAEERGSFWKTDDPGEYRLVVKGRGKDLDGKEIEGEASARFLVHHEDAEMLRQAADHDFLAKLAHAGGGRANRAEELPQFLREMESMPLPQNQGKSKLWPEWRRTPSTPAARDQARALLASGILPTFVLFAGLVSLEWFLRRKWGLV